MLAIAYMSIATTSVYQNKLSRYNWAEAVCVLIIFTIEDVILPISYWRCGCVINTYGRCQPSSDPHSGRSALCLWMCTGPLIYSLPLQRPYLYCTVVSQCSSPNCAMSQLVACHVLNVSCVCPALCDHFTVCCVQGNMLLCHKLRTCV